MTVLIDMNLSPTWVATLAEAGHDAVHWTSIGSPAAPDSELMIWARTHGAVLLTCDLGFGAVLASAGASAPSVVQLRMDDVLPDAAGHAVLVALDQFEGHLATGALVSVDADRARGRVLPL